MIGLNSNYLRMLCTANGNTKLQRTKAQLQKSHSTEKKQITHWESQCFSQTKSKTKIIEHVYMHINILILYNQNIQIC